MSWAFQQIISVEAECFQIQSLCLPWDKLWSTCSLAWCHRTLHHMVDFALKLGSIVIHEPDHIVCHWDWNRLLRTVVLACKRDSFARWQFIWSKFAWRWWHSSYNLSDVGQSIPTWSWSLPPNFLCANWLHLLREWWRSVCSFVFHCAFDNVPLSLGFEEALNWSSWSPCVCNRLWLVLSFRDLRVDGVL